MCYRAVNPLHSLTKHVLILVRTVLQLILTIAAEPKLIYQVTVMKLLAPAQHRY